MRNDIHSVARRAGLGTVLTLAVTALVVGIPVVTGASTPVTLDSSSSLATHGDGRGGSPVVLGVDGIPGLGVPGAPPAPAAAPAPEVVVPAPAPAPPAEPEPEPVEADPPSPPVAAAITVAGPEAEVLALVNQERAAAGCGALAADDALAAVARGHSADMRDRDFFDHTNPDGLDPL